MIATQSIDELNALFALPDNVNFDAGEGGLTRMHLRAQGAKAQVYLHGAHVTHWRPKDAEPVLWMSRKSWFEEEQPIRGGVPICLPWFGTRDDAPDAPNHGFGRLHPWRVTDTAVNQDGSISATLAFEPGEDLFIAWSNPFKAALTVTVGERLTLSLAVTNTGDKAMTFTEALHTYLAVGDVRDIAITGLEGASYLSKTEGGRFTQGDEPIRFAGMVDRVFTGSDAACVLDDPGYNRRITVAKTGSKSTVVWNPHIEKAEAMPDFGDDEWPGMVCIETANALDDAVTLAPGATHVMEARLTVD